MLFFPLREDGFIPYWIYTGPQVYRLPNLSGVIQAEGSAFGKEGRAWIANAPLSLHLKERVFQNLSSLLKEFNDPLQKSLIWSESLYPSGAPQSKTMSDKDKRYDTPESQRVVSRIEETPEDGCLDFSRFSFVPEYYDAFASCLLDCDEDQELVCMVPVLGPCGMNVNGKWIFHRKGPFGYIEPEWIPVRVPVRKGINRIVQFGQMIGWREARIVLGLRILTGSPVESRRLAWVRVGIPILEGDPIQWMRDAEVLKRVGFRQFCFPDGKISLYIGSSNQESHLVPDGASGSGGASRSELERKTNPSGQAPEAIESIKTVESIEDIAAIADIDLKLSFPPQENYVAGDTSEVKPPFWIRRINLRNMRENMGTGRDGGKARQNIKVQNGWKVSVEPDAAFLQTLRKFPPHVPLDVQVRIPGSSYPGRKVGKIYLPRYPYAVLPWGDYQSRKQEALEVLSEIEEAPFGVLAALALQRKKGIGPRILKTCIEFLEERRDCADFYALALLVALYRFGEGSHKSFPGTRSSRGTDPRRGDLWNSRSAALESERIPRSEQEAIRKALLGFKYWHDEPGVDAMCWFTENHQIIFHTAGYLAGSLYPDAWFRSSGLPGKKLAERCARRLIAWILPRLQGGYSEWDSNTYLAMDTYALLALAEFALSPRIQKMATTLLDKTFFMIACQSIRGAHGCTHGRCYTEGLKTARVESTSGLQRIAWGMGGFNGETWATGMLALAAKYQVHPLIESIGADFPPLLETKSCSYGRYYLKRDLRQGRWEVHTFSRRTPHYLLSAALDHSPGEPGIQEHLWQMTFSPEAVLFTTWPGNSQEHGNARPNYWAGSARLPRVAMEGRHLVCIYNPQETAGLGFGHAYCPRDVFDEVVERDPWVFVRYRKGYGALCADGALYWVRTGPHAFQELRSKGGGKVFLSVAGSEDEDGDFATFQKKCINTQPSIRGDWVGFHSLEGTRLEFSWQGPLWVDGKPETLRFSWHYQNLYTHTPLAARTMILQKENKTLRLDLSL